MRVALSRGFNDSGPMIFTRRLFDCLTAEFGVKIVDKSKRPDVVFAVIQFNKRDMPKSSKVVLRVDGLYWDTKQYNLNHNKPIFASIKNAHGVVFQSEFCRKCYSAFMGGIKTRNTVIMNGVDFQEVRSIVPENLPYYPGLVSNAKWRPTKRPGCICRGFLQADIPHHLYMVGDPPDKLIKNDKVHWLGKKSTKDSIAITKACSHAIHLAKLDPCPNSVIEQVACGLPVLHTNNGGTPDIVRKHGICIECDDWDYKPMQGVSKISPEVVAAGLEQLVTMDLYSPPPDLDIRHAARQYYEFFVGVLS